MIQSDADSEVLFQLCKAFPSQTRIEIARRRSFSKPAFLCKPKPGKSSKVDPGLSLESLLVGASEVGPKRHGQEVFRKATPPSSAKFESQSRPRAIPQALVSAETQFPSFCTEHKARSALFWEEKLKGAREALFFKRKKSKAAKLKWPRSADFFLKESFLEAEVFLEARVAILSKEKQSG